MSVTSTSLNIPIPASVVVRPRPVRSYLLFALCTTLYLFPFMRLLLIGPDEGMLVAGAVRVAHGQVFSRDFFEIVGPGTFYWLALFFKLFGVSFLAERLCLFVSSFGTALAIYFLSRRVCPRYQLLPCIVTVATYFGMVWPTVSHHVDSNFFGLLSVASMVLWWGRRTGAFLFAAGALTGITALVHQPKGALLLLAFVAWLLVLARRRLAPLSSLTLVASGFFLPVALALIYFWRQHALWDVIYAGYIWPATHYGPANVVPYAQGIFIQYWPIWSGLGHGAWTAVPAILVIAYFFIALLPVLLLILAIINRNSPFSPEILLYWLCGSALWLAEIHRKDIQHLAFGSPLLVILFVHYLSQERTRLANAALQVLSISAVCLASFNLLLVLNAHPFTTRAGSVAVFKDDPVVTYLNGHLAPNQELFVYPYIPIYYFLTDTTNPTRWSGLIGYNYNSRAEFQEVTRTLDQHRVQYVVWDTLEADRMHRFSPELHWPRPGEQVMEPYLESHYNVVWEQDGVRIMERRSDYAAK